MKAILAAAIMTAGLAISPALAQTQSGVPTGSMQSTGQGKTAPSGGPSTSGAAGEMSHPGTTGSSTPAPNREMKQNMPPKGNVSGSTPRPEGPSR